MIISIMYRYFSVAVWDIGFADFKFDMRRLQEILAFPKAWYRSGLARRLFLGDESISNNVGKLSPPTLIKSINMR